MQVRIESKQIVRKLKLLAVYNNTSVPKTVLGIIEAYFLANRKSK